MLMGGTPELLNEGGMMPDSYPNDQYSGFRIDQGAQQYEN